MLKSFWPLWLLAVALTLCIMAIAWQQGELREQAESMGIMQSAHEANAKTLEALLERQVKTDQSLLAWDAKNTELATKAKTKTKIVREAGKNADFTAWADQPLPADACRVLQSTGLAH